MTRRCSGQTRSLDARRDTASRELTCPHPTPRSAGLAHPVGGQRQPAEPGAAGPRVLRKPGRVRRRRLRAQAGLAGRDAGARGRRRDGLPGSLGRSRLARRSGTQRPALRRGGGAGRRERRRRHATCRAGNTAAAGGGGVGRGLRGKPARGGARAGRLRPLRKAAASRPRATAHGAATARAGGAPEEQTAEVPARRCRQRAGRPRRPVGGGARHVAFAADACGGGVCAAPRGGRDHPEHARAFGAAGAT